METIKNATGFGSSSSPQAPDHTEAEKQHLYSNLSDEQKSKQTYTEWVKEAYADQYEKWMPWIEDQYLKWFGKGDNKASYATKEQLNKAKVTGIPQVDQLQDDVHNLVANQVGDRGFLAPVGNMVSKEGINRAERGGKDEDGGYGAGTMEYAKSAGGAVAGGAQSAGGAVAGGAQTVGGGLVSGAKGAGSAVGGLFGGGKKEEGESESAAAQEKPEVK